jgi:hypothetical protein
MILGPLEAREVFHLEFLRSFLRVVPPAAFALKGGTNLRLFFASPRYSEDMGLDLSGIPVHEVIDRVMKILAAPALLSTLRTFGIERIVPPDLSAAKQTQTVQRFKVHLLTESALDLFTKIEISRRGLDSPARVESVSAGVPGRYRLGPLLVPHYLATAAIRQKVRALAARKQVEARDIFDLYTLSTRPEALEASLWKEIDATHFDQALERLFQVSYAEYRDKVVPYLPPEDRKSYDTEGAWDEMCLRVEQLFAQGFKTRGQGKEGGRA